MGRAWNCILADGRHEKVHSWKVNILKGSSESQVALLESGHEWSTKSKHGPPVFAPLASMGGKRREGVGQCVPLAPLNPLIKHML